MTDPDPLATKLPDLFRLGMRRHANSVCIITTVHDGRRHGMTATAIASVCANPPTLLVCINQAASLHGPIKASGRFAVNLLSGNHRDIALRFSGSGPRQRRFGDERWRERNGWAYLDDARASFPLTTESAFDHYGHAVPIGRVEDILLGGHSTPPLIYHDGRYSHASLHEV